MPVLSAFAGKPNTRVGRSSSPALGMGLLEKLSAENLGGPFWITSASRDTVAESLGPAMDKGIMMLLVTVASRDDVQLMYPHPEAK
jgi:hypothetical protein